MPQVVTAGTITRRAVEPTWLTASNARVCVRCPLFPVLPLLGPLETGVQRPFGEGREKEPKFWARQDSGSHLALQLLRSFSKLDLSPLLVARH